MTLRIVVADDHTIVREGLRALLTAVDGYELIGTVPDRPRSRPSVRQSPRSDVMVMVMDIQMPLDEWHRRDAGDHDATRDITRMAPDVAVLMLTMAIDDESVFAAMRAGALGYVVKGASPDNMIQAITTPRTASVAAHEYQELAR